MSTYEAKKKRMDKAMNCEKPDRVPIRLSSSEFSAKYAGYRNEEIYYELDKNVDAATKLLEGLEIDSFTGAPSLWWASLHDAVGAVYLKFAGHDLEPDAQFQYHEDQYMLPEDYDAFIANPTEWIVQTFLPRIHTEMKEPGSYRANMSLIKGAFAFAQQNGQTGAAQSMWTEKFGVVPAMTGLGKAPFDTLGDALRGLSGIMMDMYQRPEKVKQALEVIIPHNIFFGMATSGGDTEHPLFIPLHRGAYPFLNMKQWEEFYWPSLKQVIEGYWANGKQTVFFAEGDWTPYLEHIAELPEKSIVFHVDQTDIDKAYQVLGGRFCLSGNVPNTMLALGTPEEVEDYVKRLLDKYAQDGGFILDAAAVIQDDAKIENVEAMVEAVHKHGVY